MSEESSADGPDFRQGVLLDMVADGQMLLGHVAGEPALLIQRAEGLFAVGATWYSLWRAAGRGSPSRGYSAMPLASRVLQLAHGCGLAATSAERLTAMAGRAARWHGVRMRAAASRSSANTGCCPPTSFDRHHRRRRLG